MAAFIGKELRNNVADRSLLPIAEVHKWNQRWCSLSPHFIEHLWNCSLDSQSEMRCQDSLRKLTCRLVIDRFARQYFLAAQHRLVGEAPSTMACAFEMISHSIGRVPLLLVSDAIRQWKKACSIKRLSTYFFKKGYKHFKFSTETFAGWKCFS